VKNYFYKKFKKSSVGDSFGPTFATHWFKLEFQIPLEWKGEEVHLLWNSETEAMVWRDDKPAQGLSGLGWQGRGEYPITYCSQGNEKIVLFVEMACNGLFGAGYPVPHDPPNMNKYYTLKQV
jgi:alpha-mannosidase